MPSFQLSYPSPVKGTKIGSINALTRKEKEVEPLTGDVVDMRGRRIMLEAHCSLQGAARAAMPSTHPRVLSSNDGLPLHSHRRQAFSLRSAPPLASSAPGDAPQLAEDSQKGSDESEAEPDDDSEAASDDDSQQPGGEGAVFPEKNSHAARPGSLPPQPVSLTVGKGPHARSSALSLTLTGLVQLEETVGSACHDHSPSMKSILSSCRQ